MNKHNIGGGGGVEGKQTPVQLVFRSDYSGDLSPVAEKYGEGASPFQRAA